MVLFYKELDHIEEVICISVISEISTKMQYNKLFCHCRLSDAFSPLIHCFCYNKAHQENVLDFLCQTLHLAFDNKPLWTS